jgi:Ca-activated chloride channel homolog
MRWFRYTEYKSDREDIQTQARDFLNRLIDYIFITDGNLREALELMKEEGEFGDGEEADRRAEERFTILEETDYIDQEGNAPKLSSNGFRALSEKTLQELLASIQKDHSGQHEITRHGWGDVWDFESKSWQFGDPLNLNIQSTFQNAFIRRGVHLPVDLESDDLEILEAEHQSQCATVLMLDISHSMILYGEDRFTPAKKVALALIHLIRTHYPMDTIDALLFYDDAKEIAPERLLTCKVGPFYTNTKAGLALAQRILARYPGRNKQIVMITDGKPSAIHYQGETIRHSWWDPWIIQETLYEAEKCRTKGIRINTFMLANDSMLLEFIKKQTQITRGAAYLTSPETLGHRLLVDYMQQKNHR